MLFGDQNYVFIIQINDTEPITGKNASQKDYIHKTKIFNIS